MSTIENKEKVRRLFEDGLNNDNFDFLGTMIADNYVNHNMPAPSPGPEGLMQVLKTFKNAFPDMKITLHEVIGEGERVVTRGSWKGTHNGSFMGIPATGKNVEVNYIDIWRFENDKAVENWVQMDILGLMVQLGVVPSP
jgi:steroid delta-isomerase-like uncharacterized protein